MAQGRSVQRFLAHSATRASAGVILALVLVALLLPGCGGGSSDGSSSIAAGAEASRSPSSGDPGGEGGSAASPDGTIDGSGSNPGAAGEPSGDSVSGGGSSAGANDPPHVPQPTGAPEPGITPQQRREATVASMTLESPDLVAGGGSLLGLPAKFTCDGADTWPTLHWKGTPAGTVELALFAMNIQPVDGHIFFDWALTGIDPGLDEIETADLGGVE